MIYIDDIMIIRRDTNTISHYKIRQQVILKDVRRS